MTALAERTLDARASGDAAGARILFVSPAAYPLGGIADWLDYALRGLAVRGYQCKLALVEGGGHDPARYLERHPWHNVEIVSNPTGSREGRVLALMQAIRAAAPDLVLSINLVDVYEAIRRIRLAKAAGPRPRVAMTLHGIQADLLADIANHQDVLDAVVATNKLAARMAVDQMGDSERVCYAQYGVPVIGDEHAQSRSIHASQLRLLYAGRIEQEQKRVLDLPPLLVALRRLGVNATLSVAGAGPAEEDLRAACASAGVEAWVHWAGLLEPSDLRQAYRSHDALVITSVWETGPIVAWEAMSHGLPVVSSRYLGSGVEAALLDGCNARLFDVGDIDAAANAAASLLLPDCRARVVAGAYDLVASRYSQQASVAAWDAAVSAILRLPSLATPRRAQFSPPSGRLDRVFGVQMGERLRSILATRFRHMTPGSAWPHTGSIDADAQAYMEQAMQLDRDADSITLQSSMKSEATDRWPRIDTLATSRHIP